MFSGSKVRFARVWGSHVSAVPYVLVLVMNASLEQLLEDTLKK